MFQLDTINVPVLGLIENMAYFTPAELPTNRYYIFGKEGCRNMAAEMGVPLLGEIPIVQSIREGGDTGIPVALDDEGAVSAAFAEAADQLIRQTAIRNAEKAPTRRVNAVSY
jgi:ATP-binding protein involved in chromosome partitioning